MKKFARKCDVTKKGMNAGYVFNDGEMYASDKESAIKLAFDVYGFQSLGDAYDNGMCYYTEWEEVDEDFFFDADGNEYHEVDSFVWNIVSKEKAIELFESGKEVFKLYSDGSEALIENELDFLDSEVIYGVEIK